MPSKPKNKNVYLHGYSKKEQLRLIKQAKFLETETYRDVDFKKCKKIIEVGCGVGAQTEILLKRFPHLKILGIDLSSAQIDLAKRRLHKEVKSGRVRFIVMNAEDLRHLKEKFDGAFICWFLEHVPNPLKILKSLNKILKPSAKVFCTEVQNAGFFVNPYSPNILKYWFEFNDFQWEHKGNPFIGATLGNLMLKAKYKKIKVDPRALIYDSRNREERKKFLLYFKDLLFSAKENLIKDKRISKRQLVKVNQEISKMIRDENAAIQLDYFRVVASR